MIFLSKRGRVGIASLMKDPHQIETWINFHKKSGASKLYIYWDSDEPMPKEDSVVKVTRVTQDFLDSNGYHIESGWDNPTITNEKQRVAVDHALSQDEVDWVFHIDADEILYTPDKNLVKLVDEFDNDPMVDTWVIQNVELAPDRDDYSNCFKEGKKFRRGENMVAYGNGKSAGRLGTSKSFGPHRFVSTRNGQERELPIERIRVLHFVSCNLEEYMKKYQQYGKFKDDIWDWAVFHRKSRDVLTSCSSKEACTAQARDLFNKERIAKPEEQLIELETPIDTE